MITLIVGVPGSGKTWYAVEKLIPKLLKSKKRCFSNIRGHVDAKKTFGFDEDFTISDFDNSLVVLDEVQFFSLRDASGVFFRHLTVHRHTGRDYVFITQSTAALPRKWLGLVEKTIEISSIAGSQFSRARHYQGIPKITNPVLAEEKFKPCATDKYQTVEEGVEETKRTVPFYVYKMAGGLCAAVAVTGFIAFAVMNHFFPDKEKSAVVVAEANVQGDHLDNTKVIPVLEDESKPDESTIAETKAINPQIAHFPMNLDDALSFLDDGKPIHHIVKCGKNFYSDNPNIDCNLRRRRLVSGSVESFRLSSDYSKL